MKTVLGFMAGLIILSLCAFSAYAQEAQQQAAPAPAATAAPAPAPAAAAAPAPAAPKTVGNMTVDELRAALGISLYFQGGYAYNTKNPGSMQNDLRDFDHEANSFTLDLAQIRFQKDADVGGLGYNFKFSFGETAKLIHSGGLGSQTLSPQTSSLSGETPFDMTQAFVTYNAPIGKGLQFSFGKFVAPETAEVIEAMDNFNYSRSFLFNYAVPFTLTGLKTYYAFADAFNAALYLVNGWDVTTDNNTGKTVGLSFGVTPVQPFNMAFNFLYGPEQNHTNSSDRFLFDWVATLNATKNLTFVLNTDWATEQNVPTALGVHDARWYGIAGYAKYSFNDWFALAARGEWFNDPEGVRTYSALTSNTTAPVLPSGVGRTLKEGTFTTEFKVAKNLILRPEYRHDWSDQYSFDAGRYKTQDTISLGAMYLF